MGSEAGEDVVIYVDLDDFHEGNHSMELLNQLKAEIPQFRVTLFTVPGRCSECFITRIKGLDWIDMVPHGMVHSNSRECQNWDYERTHAYLDWVEKLRLTRGFKAPGWQISDATYAALLTRGYWVADQQYNNYRRPVGLPVYLLDSPNKIHGHIGHMGGHNPNELSLILPTILALKHEEFGFVKDLVF